MLQFNTEINTIMMEVDVAALLMSTKSNISTLNLNHILQIESLLSLINQI
jgi:hypothetical protein